MTATDNELRMPLPVWAAILREPAGGGRAKNVPAREHAAVMAYLDALQAALAVAPGPRELITLGDIGRLKLVQLRLAREVFQRTRNRVTGDVRPSVGELRATTRLLHDLTNSLRFRDGSKAQEPTVEDLWSGDEDS